MEKEQIKDKALEAADEAFEAFAILLKEVPEFNTSKEIEKKLVALSLDVTNKLTKYKTLKELL